MRKSVEDMIPRRDILIVKLLHSLQRTKESDFVWLRITDEGSVPEMRI